MECWTNMFYFRYIWYLSTYYSHVNKIYCTQKILSKCLPLPDTGKEVGPFQELYAKLRYSICIPSSPSISMPSPSSGGQSIFRHLCLPHPSNKRSKQRWETHQNRCTVVVCASTCYSASMYLPHGPDSSLEQMDVAMATQFPRSDKEAVESPKLLNLEEKVAGHELNQPECLCDVNKR